MSPRTLPVAAETQAPLPEPPLRPAMAPVLDAGGPEDGESGRGGPIRGDHTRMVTVLRDGNPRRRLGLTSPFIGKLGDADLEALDGLSAQAANALRPWAGHPTPSTLLVGLAESSLMLAWFLRARLGAADLCFSSRLPNGRAEVCRFEEPHSHGPRHHLTLPDGRYARVVIVEDEITSGRTLQNLVVALAPRASVFEVVTIRDLRTAAARLEMDVAFQRANLAVRITALDGDTPTRPTRMGPARRRLEGPRCWQPEAARVQASTDLARLVALAERHRVGAVFAVGEAVDLPLCLVSARDGALRPASAPRDAQPLAGGRRRHSGPRGLGARHRRRAPLSLQPARPGRCAGRRRGGAPGRGRQHRSGDGLAGASPARSWNHCHSL
jgi:hypothetical protein